MWVCRVHLLPELAQQPWFSWSPLLSHQTATGWDVQGWALSPKDRAFLRLPVLDASAVISWLGSGFKV